MGSGYLQLLPLRREHSLDFKRSWQKLTQLLKQSETGDIQWTWEQTGEY